MRKYIIVEVDENVSRQKAENYLEYFLSSLMDDKVSGAICPVNQLENLIVDFKKRHTVVEIFDKNINFMSTKLIIHESTFS